jgi:hypothetical protein
MDATSGRRCERRVSEAAMMGVTTQWVFWGGAALAVLAPFLLERPFSVSGRLALGGVIFAAAMGIAQFLTANECWRTYVGETRCYTPDSVLMFRMAGTASLVAGLLLAGAIASRRTLYRRVLFGACVPAAAMAFFPLIFSIGVFLILWAWGLLIAAIIKDPPMLLRQ